MSWLLFIILDDLMTTNHIFWLLFIILVPDDDLITTNHVLVTIHYPGD